MARLGFIYDIELCTGCKACQIACKDRHDLPRGLFFRRAAVFEYEGDMQKYSGACNHCEQAVCMENCPTAALFRAADGTVGHHDGRCIACGACVWNCPYGAPSLSPSKGTSQKCDACFDLRRQGIEPVCVSACVTQCLRFGEIEGEDRRPPFLPKLATEEIVVRQDVFSTVPATFQNNSDRHFLIIGNGAAGLSAAAAIRARDTDCRITLLGEEGVDSYSRPMLTKAALRGFSISGFTVFETSWYRENRIDNRTGSRAIGIDAANKRVSLADGSQLCYDRCIIATGAACFIPPFAGGNLARVHGIRTVKDIETIRKELPVTRSLVVIGGGVIGLETAWELRKTGCEVTVLEAAKTLMERLLDTASAQLLKARMAAAGVRVHADVQVERILDGGGYATGVRLTDGRVFDADMVVISCGIKANTGLAAGAGCAVGRAVTVDAYMRTSVPDIYACGDCAETNGLNQGLWEEAARQGYVAGAVAAGDNISWSPEIPAVILYAFDTALYAVGDTGKTAEKEYGIVTFEGNTAPQSEFFLVNEPQADYCAERYFFTDSHLVGGVLMGDLRMMTKLKTAVTQRMEKQAFLKRRGGDE